MKIYLGDNNVAKEIKDLYYGIENKTQKIVAAYMGVNNKAHCIFDNHVTVPNMTSSTTPYGVAEASTVKTSTTTEDFEAWRAFDGDDTTYWSTPSDKSTNQTCTYDFGYEIIPTNITVTTQGTTGNNSKKFTILASKDNTNWTTLSSYTGTANLTDQKYTYTTTTSYRYFSFKTHSSATSNNSEKRLYKFYIEGYIE